MRNKGFLIDLDGVLVKSEEFSPLSGAIEFLDILKEKNIPFKIATSNSRYSPEKIAKYMKESGFNVSPEDIVSPLSIAPEYLKQENISSVFIIGSDSLKEYMEKKSFFIKNDTEVDAVIIGMDKNINFYKLKIATTAVKRNKAKLFALNKNLISKDNDGLLFPGVGSIAKMISYACGVTFSHFGKMSDIYNSFILKKINLKPENVFIISDDLFVDLKGFSSYGMKTIFMTTGKYTKEDIPQDFKPNYIFNSLNELIKEFGINDW